MRKRSTTRPFAPDFVSAETLAYRLDCSVSTIREYVSRGLLPAPSNIGSLTRWRWSDVETHVRASINESELTEELDPFTRAVRSHA